uniref:Neprosin PEP catalytic domain-containing protein n=2 Tax=Triticum urartu TaxID=4572 RepID=A0A8R7TCH9_TRIUA
MGRGQGHVIIPIFLFFSFAPYYITLAESIDLGGTLQTNEKDGTLSRSNPFQLKGRMKTDGKGNTKSHYAMWHTEPGKFYGLRAEMSIWGSPNQENSQESGSAIQIYCQEGEHYSLIEAGFHVSPSLYHNRDVRFFTYTTRDTKSAGCYNLQCPGFVPARGAALVPGQAISPPSIYGQADHYARLSLNKDPNSGDWVVYRHDLDRPSFLGHFPGQLCPGESRIQALTGFVNYLNNTHGPPMGSGQFPDDEDDKRSAYFKHIKIYDANGHARDPITTHMIKLVDRPDCYKETDFTVKINRGYIFYYGGPNGCIG